jgi:hypothetical protein
MAKPGYKLSFTAAGLSINESVNIAEAYLSCGDWDETRQIVREKNLLQSRTNSRTVRVARELIQRLKLLTRDQLELLAEGSLAEQKFLLWFAACKTYALIQEFAIEVLREKFLSRNMTLTELDYDAFFNRKADWHEDLDAITETTRIKLKTVLFRMMREADLITDDNLILPSMLSKRLVDVLKQDAPMSFQIFPMEPFDRRG